MNDKKESCILSGAMKGENKKQQLLYRAEKLGDLMCILGEHLQMTGYQELGGRLSIAFRKLEEEIKKD